MGRFRKQYTYLAFCAQSGAGLIGLYRPVESHSGARETFSRGPQKMFAVPLWGKFFKNYSFQNGAFWCIFVLLSDGGASAQTSWGPG